MSDFRKFQNYYEQYMSKVHAYIRSRTNYDTQLAEDLTSEIFMKALRKFETFSQDQGSFSSWIFKITKNHLIDHYRSQKNKHDSPIEEFENVLRSESDTQKKASNSIEIENLKKVMHTLSPEKQEIISLKYLSGYSYKEIAEILGTQENSIRVTAHRALKELKHKLFETDYEN